MLHLRARKPFWTVQPVNLPFIRGNLIPMDPVRPRKLFDSTIGVRGAVSVSVFLAPFFGLALGCSDSYSSSLASGHFYGGLRDGGYGICVIWCNQDRCGIESGKLLLRRLPLRRLSRNSPISQIVKFISMTTFPPWGNSSPPESLALSKGSFLFTYFTYHF